MHTLAATAPLTVGSAIRAWRLTPGVVATVGIGTAYAAGIRAVHRRGERWPAGRSVFFGLGLLVLLAATGGWLQAWSRTLLWVYTSQVLVLLLVAPMLLVLGRPVTMLRLARPGAGRLPGVVRALSSPLVGPALIPVVTAGVFFTPLLDASVRHVAVGWAVRLGLVAVGLVFTLPLAGEDGENALPLALAIAAFVGLIELLLDAFPGMVMRLRTHVLDPSWFGVGRHWGQSPLSDQQMAGAILWAVAELLDLPFLAFIVWQWIRADARQAIEVDAELDARAVSAVLADEPGSGEPGRERPWWETDASVLGERRAAELRRAADRQSRRSR